MTTQAILTELNARAAAMGISVSVSRFDGKLYAFEVAGKVLHRAATAADARRFLDAAERSGQTAGIVAQARAEALASRDDEATQHPAGPVTVRYNGAGGHAYYLRAAGTWAFGSVAGSDAKRFASVTAARTWLSENGFELDPNAVAFEPAPPAPIEPAASVVGAPAPAMVPQPSQPQQGRDVRAALTLETWSVTMPEHWAGYLVNGNAAGLSDAEIAHIRAHLSRHLPEGGHVVSMQEGSERFTWSADLYGGAPERGCTVAVYDVLAPREADIPLIPAVAPMVPQPCQQQQARARGRALQPARGERRYVTVRDTETGDLHRVLTSVARVGVAVVIFTPSNRHRQGALGGMLITHDDIRKAWVFNDEAEARRMLSRNGAPGERVIRAELVSDPAVA
jgi:hypothetical protein